MRDGFGCSSSTGPSEPNAYGTFEGTRNSEYCRLDVDSDGTDCEQSPEAIQDTQSAYYTAKTRTLHITNPNANAAGTPKDAIPSKDRSV
jgi:hypothetical protein